MNKNISPLVSVIIPLYNAEKYIFQALESIVNQTYQNIEIIVIDDGSTDNSEDIVYSIHSSKIKLIKNEHNLGVSATRNRGIELARGKYIALMDADDISYLDRIEKQVNFLEKHNDFGLISSHYESFRKGIFGTKRRVRKVPTDPEEIRTTLLFMNAITCPASMLRKSVLEDHKLHFDTSLQIAEDYDLWKRLSFVTKIGNINQPLLHYRKHRNNSTKKRNIAARDYTKVVMKTFEHFGLSVDDLFNEDYKLKDIQSFQKLYDEMEHILKINKQKGLYNLVYLENSATIFLENMFRKHLNLFGCELFRLCGELTLCKGIKLKFKERFKYLLCVLFKLEKSK